MPEHEKTAMQHCSVDPSVSGQMHPLQNNPGRLTALVRRPGFVFNYCLASVPVPGLGPRLRRRRFAGFSGAAVF